MLRFIAEASKREWSLLGIILAPRFVLVIFPLILRDAGLIAKVMAAVSIGFKATRRMFNQIAFSLKASPASRCCADDSKIPFSNSPFEEKARLGDPVRANVEGSRM
jgi:hypothetical protein